MNVIIIGCGQVGVELALSIQRAHSVTVIDSDTAAFDRLGPDFTGRTVQGEALDRDVLVRAGIETADALSAVTASDNVNAIVGRVALEVFKVKQVVVRVYNPRRGMVYDELGLQTVSSSSWGAQRIEQLLTQPWIQRVASAGRGNVQVLELTVPPEWDGRRLAEIVPREHAVPVAVVRRGQAHLPQADTALAAGDLLHVSVTTEGERILRQRFGPSVDDSRRE